MKIFKILKKYSWMIILIIALLYVQAQCDLSLPEYLSRIVDTGIVQSGIENTAIEQVRETEMDKLFLFMTAEEQEYIQTKYDLEDGVYKRNTSEKADIEKISSIFNMPMTIVFSLSSDLGESNGISGSIPGIEIPEGSDLFEIISMMPAEMAGAITGSIIESFSAYDELGIALEQTAIEYIKTEYTVLGIDLADMQNHYILIAGLKMIGFTIIIIAAVALINFFSSRIAAFFSRDARNMVFSKVLSFSGNEFNKFSTASLITRCTNDIQQVQMLLQMTLRMVIYAPILGIGALVKIQGSPLSWVLALAVGLILILMVTLLIITMPKFSKFQKLIDKINLVTREILTGLPVIRAFSREKYEEKRFDEANVNLTKTNLFITRVMAFMMPLMNLLLNCVSLLIIWIGAKSIDAGSMQIGELIAFPQYAMMIIMSFLMLSMMSIQMPRALVSLRRINEILNTETTIIEQDKPVAMDSFKKGTVEFKNVSFKYPGADEYVIQDITFTAEKGETIAVIGPTGSGKSTLINLIPRFYDVTDGEITVNGVDIKKVSLKELRDNIGYVPQKAILFSGTIESNIAYGLDGYTLDEVETAAAVAQAKGFIEEKDESYQSEISQGGTNVSGGQRQRLSIARAVAKNAPIYIFDDSFSALDFKTDTELRRELNEHTGDSTKIIVAQRISTVLNADKIIVLDEGRMAGIGNHKQLMAECDIYREIALSQLSEKEAE